MYVTNSYLDILKTRSPNPDCIGCELSDLVTIMIAVKV